MIEDYVLLSCGHLEVRYGSVRIIGTKRGEWWQACHPCGELRLIKRTATIEDMIGKINEQGSLF